MTFMPEDVLNKNFTATQFRRGYDEQEVDDFLDEVVVELRRLSSENEDLGAQLKACQESKGVPATEAKDLIAAAKVSAEQAEKDAAARISKAEADAEQAEAQAAERMKAAVEAADKAVKSSFVVPAATKAEVRGDAGAVAAGVGSAAGVLALAQKLHEEYVAEGQNTRDRLINEGQSHHDKVVGEAAAKQEELLSTGQTKHDALIAEATAQHDKLITEARERSTGMLAEAQQTRTEVLAALSRERDLLQKKVDELRAFERDYRARLKSYLEGQLNELEQTGGNNAADDQDKGKSPDEGQRNGAQNGGAQNGGHQDGGS